VASEHGLVAFCRAVFLDVRDRGVEVCAIAPGLVDAGASQVFPPRRASASCNLATWPTPCSMR
jgi:NAD(P)-dependent dehydrogenase (short-subunit alcohol dehydrogenase family)